MKILALAAAALLAPVGAAAFWIHSTAEHRAAAMASRLRQLRSEALAPDTARRAGTESGNAWENYLKALAGASKLDSYKLDALVERKETADPAYGTAALAGSGSAIDHLLQGSRRASCVPPETIDWINASRGDALLRLVILRARALSEEGKGERAVDLLLALCQFGRDVAESPSGLGEYTSDWALKLSFVELRDALLRPAWPPADFAALESRLELLDEAFPRLEQIRRRKLRRLGALHEERAQESGIVASLRSWRYGFSPRIQWAVVFESWDRWIHQAMEADRLPWPKVRAELNRIRAEIEGAPLVEQGVLEEEIRHRVLRTQLRLLRAAARYRRTGEILILDDPFGGKLLHREAGGRLTLWSVAWDGLDEGGKGKWELRTTGDIVIEVPR